MADTFYQPEIPLNLTIAPPVFFNSSSESQLGTHESLGEMAVVSPDTDIAAGVNGPFVTASAKVSVAYSAFLCLVGMILNGTLVFIITCSRRGRVNASSVLTLHMASVDLCTVLLYVPVFVCSLLNVIYTEPLCKLMMAAQKSLFAGIMWSLTIASGDRYLYIVKHNIYYSKLTKGKTLAIAAGVWLYVIIICVVVFMEVTCTCTPSKPCFCHVSYLYHGIFHLIFTAMYLTLSWVLPLTCMFVFYGFIVHRLNRNITFGAKNPFLKYSYTRLENGSKNSSACNDETSSSPSVLSTQQHEQKNMAQTMILFVCAHTVCSLPYFISQIVATVTNRKNAEVGHSLPSVTVLLMATNSLLNPMFCMYIHRKSIASLLRDFRCRDSRRNAASIPRNARHTRTSLESLASKRNGTVQESLLSSVALQQANLLCSRTCCVCGFNSPSEDRTSLSAADNRSTCDSPTSTENSCLSASPLHNLSSFSNDCQSPHSLPMAETIQEEENSVIIGRLIFPKQSDCQANLRRDMEGDRVCNGNLRNSRPRNDWAL